MNGIKIKQYFETHYPIKLAYEWDNVGLQIGTLNKEVTGILLTLDVTKEVVQEALDEHCNVIIAHHPLIFKPLKNILTDAYKGQLIETLIKHDITVYVAHTNYDLGDRGMNTMLADKLALKNQEILEFETESHGIGRIGEIEPMHLDEAVDYIKSKLSLTHVRLVNKKSNKRIKRIAISGGSGASHMFSAKFKNADLYLTGDISYHQAQDMIQMGLSAIDIGHYAEKHFSEALKQDLLNDGFDVKLYVSQQDLDPFTFV